ncbi:hypothetical protein IMZ31_23035 (plasmid) [Pontibacillus sp. ALD_SL1]|uniref:hypothetical protein n=1 Tax=Pontibacillus sp. ALD_SL1 TaxID=2777185 RepID=UPI001A96942D|nr:hypothetical protein [Pontibacillus sp. ALD_SL1]QST02329.1 hypothetical protein IMZ31_23035 [Pontibacillus sp. ALD_SL1]
MLRALELTHVALELEKWEGREAVFSEEFVSDMKHLEKKGFIVSEQRGRVDLLYGGKSLIQLFIRRGCFHIEDECLWAEVEMFISDERL